MKFYIHNITRYNSGMDIKSLIPDANMRRRMSSFLKMGVATAMKSLQDSNIGEIGGVITSTWLGALTDSEKFLKSIKMNGEELLNPTPFIQSTANTLGGQIALITKCHGYNNTYTDMENGLRNALLDAMMTIADGEADSLLVGEVNEEPPFLKEILSNITDGCTTITQEGAIFMVISKIQSEKALGEYTIENVDELVNFVRGWQQ